MLKAKTAETAGGRFRIIKKPITDMSLVLVPLLLTHCFCRVFFFLFVGIKELSAACWCIIQSLCPETLNGVWWDVDPGVQDNISPSGCPRRLPVPIALSGHCPGSWGRGNHGQSGLSQILSCGESRSTPLCLIPRWCLTCRLWKWGVGPRPLLVISEPRKMVRCEKQTRVQNIQTKHTNRLKQKALVKRTLCSSVFLNVAWLKG